MPAVVSQELTAELEAATTDGSRQRDLQILEQVTNGIAVRMAVLFLVNGGKGPQEISAG